MQPQCQPLQPEYHRSGGRWPQLCGTTNHPFPCTDYIPNGSTSYADITVSEESGNDQKWGKMPLLGDQIEALKTVRFRAQDNRPYLLDNLATNAN